MTTSSTSPRSSASPAGVTGPLVLGRTPVRAWWTGRSQGDQRALGDGRPPPPPVPAALAVRRLTQVHGGQVLVVTDGELPRGLRRWGASSDRVAPAGDALVAAGTSTCLAVLSADCAAVALASPEGVHAAVHAGWRGLAAGVVQRAVGVMRVLGASDVVAALGPCIHACCYEFGPAELDSLAAHYGPAVRAVSGAGRPALDLPAAVRAALGEVGVPAPAHHGGCTACGPDAYSHRRWGDEARQALLVWRVAEP